MLDIEKIDNFLILKYYSDDQPTEWIEEKFASGKSYNFKGIFRIDEKHLFDKSKEEEFTDYLFIIGELKDEYYKLDKVVFGLKNDLYLNKNIFLEEKHFRAKDRVSIMKQIDKNVSQAVYIGGEKEEILPLAEFEKLIDNFPNAHEIKLYREARVTAIINNYFENVIDKEKIYKNYINKKTTTLNNNISKEFKDSEIYKYKRILEKLKLMLNNEIQYSEHQWQNEIIQIIQLLFPKYICVIKEMKFKDLNNNTRRLDYGLIDFMGNLDIIEIKIPFDKNLVSKNIYRDNCVPNRDLSSAIMQIEKYIYYLNKSGTKGENDLSKRYKSKLPLNFNIKITNPNGIIIMGRDKNLDDIQKNDFEIIKRKYKNVIDIFTYDDLIRRMEIIVNQLKKI